MTQAQKKLRKQVLGRIHSHKIKKAVFFKSLTKQKISTKILTNEKREKNKKYTCRYCGQIRRVRGIFVWHFKKYKERTE